MNPFPTPRSVEDLLKILSSFTDYEKMESFHSGKVRCGLDGMERLVESLGRPDREVPSIHIAGSKGKGSTALMADALARGAGLRCGLYTSPHLIRLEERIAVDGKEVSADRLLRAAERALAPLRDDPTLRPTFFEFITATAMIVFAESEVDLAIYEVGLGGRLDATNVVEPLVSIITDIELEHTRRLGKTRAAIAREKAGIIKKRVPVATLLDGDDPARRVVEECARSRDATLFAPGAGLELLPDGEAFRAEIGGKTTDPFSPPPPAILQARNGTLALCAVSVAMETLGAGFRVGLPELPDAAPLTQLTLPGRFETLSAGPRVIVDGAHSPGSLRAVAAEARRITSAGRLIAVFGLARDKDVDACLAPLLPRVDEIVSVRYDSSRSRDPAELKAAAGGRGRVAQSVPEGLALARELAGRDGTIVVTGSFYAAGEARALYTTP